MYYSIILILEVAETMPFTCSMGVCVSVSICILYYHSYIALAIGFL